jgi:adenylylsulfate kinase-like enzyme
MVIVITGPIASGKSTVAQALAGELERTGVRVAVIDLDVVYDMLKTKGSTSDDASWALARRGVATLVNTFEEEGVAAVIADGSFNTPRDRAIMSRYLLADAKPRYVTLRVSFEEALRRAQGDPTRGASRDPEFLGSYFAAANRHPTVPVTDVVIDTERVTPGTAAATIASLVRPEPD